MSYIPAFKTIKQRLSIITVNGQQKVNNSFDGILAVFRELLKGVEVDEDWYLKEYPDVAAAIKAGVFSSAKSHFVECGYFEGRWPYAFEIDEDWYLKENPDVAEGIKRGGIKSARVHFFEHGYSEGRLPVPPRG